MAKGNQTAALRFQKGARYQTFPGHPSGGRGRKKEGEVHDSRGVGSPTYYMIIAITKYLRRHDVRMGLCQQCVKRKGGVGQCQQRVKRKGGVGQCQQRVKRMHANLATDPNKAHLT